jgi:hypothetical protein
MTREEGKEFANALKNNYTIDFDKLPEFCDLVISALSENKCFKGVANRKVKADSIEVWKAEIIEKEHIKELLDRIRAEIDEQYDRVHPYNIDVAQGLEMALDILDNIGKAESEDT